ncbi:hypothetical protein IAU60_001767 [Kwoniella sp. DSM 27419]
MSTVPKQIPPPASMPQAAYGASTPPYQLSQGRNTNSIRIGTWTIETTKKPILNGKEIDAAEKSLSLPLPEMTFGNNHLRLTYDPSGTASSSSQASANDGQMEKLVLQFDTLEALAGVATGEGWEERVGGGVKVSMAEKWDKKRASPTSFLSDAPVTSKPVKPHDWTFSTCYAGSVAGPSSFAQTTEHSLPLTLLARQDPVLDRILFYDDVPLYEDELHDNGESILNARIRVMPHSFFILARLFVRVDNVLFRMYDVRVYHAFDSDEVIREVSGVEAGYDDIKRNLERQSDLSPLTSPNWVSSVLSQMVQSAGRPDLYRSPAGGKPWPGLGKRVEALRLPRPQDALDGVRAGLEGVSIA